MKVDLRTGKVNELRKQNVVPGVMYGRSIESTNIQVEKQELLNALNGYGKNRTFKIRVDGKYHHVYIKSVQSRILKPNDILHVDLHRVTPKEVFTSQIPIELINQDTFLNKPQFVEVVINHIQAEYSPGQGIQSILVDVSHLDLNDKVLVRDLKIPKGITVKNDLDDVVLLIKERKIVEENMDDEKDNNTFIEESDEPFES